MNNPYNNPYNQNKYPQQGQYQQNPNSYSQPQYNYQQQQQYPQQTNYSQQQQYPQQNMGYSQPHQNPYMNQGMNSQMGFNPYSMARNLITNFADQLFFKYDNNKSGFLDVNEIQGATRELFMMNGLPAPNPQHILMLMSQFDQDRNGLLDMNEFRTFLLRLNGY